ncbi:MAG: DNA polymerase III subunit delta [Prevotella sp.]|nr:DNA polymerase III subunit delta [Prevotella sp.]
MAEKKVGSTYESIMRDLKERKFAPIYILMGEESYFIDKIADYIATNALTPEEQDFNQTILFGLDVNPSQVVDMARRYPMMAEHQVVIVKEAQNLRNLDAIEKYVDKQMMKTTILVLCFMNASLDRRKKAVGSMLTKAEMNGGVVFESKKKRENELPSFIEDYLYAKNASIDHKSAQMIADHIGSDLSRLISELDKVLISLPADNRGVTPEVVEREIGVSKDFNGFELRDAVVNRNVFKANQIIKYFDNNPKAGSIYSFLPMLFNYFQNLMTAYYAPDRTNEKSVAQYLDLKSLWGVKDYMTGLRNYSGMKTMQIISKIREIDAKSKGLDNPNAGPGELMKELIFYILH